MMILGDGAVKCVDIKSETDDHVVDSFRATIREIEAGPDFRFKHNYVQLDPLKDPTMLSFHVLMIEDSVAAFAAVQKRAHFPDRVARLGTRAWVHPDIRSRSSRMAEYRRHVNNGTTEYWNRDPVGIAKTFPLHGAIDAEYVKVLVRNGLTAGIYSKELKPGTIKSLQLQLRAYAKWDRIMQPNLFPPTHAEEAALISRSTHYKSSEDILFNVCHSSYDAGFSCWQTLWGCDLTGADEHVLRDELVECLPTTVLEDVASPA